MFQSSAARFCGVAALTGGVGAALLVPFRQLVSGKKRRHSRQSKNWCNGESH